MLFSLLSLALLMAIPPVAAEEEADREDQGGAAEPGAEGDETGEVFVVEEPRTVVRALPGATVTTLDVSEQAARVLDLGDLLASAPGVRVRSCGGTGSAQLVQLRGATGGEVRVLVDGVPLPQDASGAVDLSSLPLDSLERIEVYRGTLPLGLGGEGVGGAINLVTRQVRGLGELRLTGAVGSFHTYEGSLGADLGWGDWRGGAWLAGSSARNDFLFLDDNGTPYTSADDRVDTRRENADVRRLEVSTRALRDGDRGRLSIGAGGLAREAGVPGSSSYQVSSARLGQQRATGAVRYEGGGDLRGSVGIGGQLDASHYLDTDGEVGLGAQDDRSLAWAVSADGLLDWRYLGEQHVALALRAEEQALEADNALDDVEPALRQRERLSGTLEARGSWRIVGYGARLAMDLSHARADGSMPMVVGTEQPGDTLLLTSPAGSLTLQPTSWLGLRASGGMAHRLPSFPELYGDAGTVVGNEELRPERGVMVDGGADLARQLGEAGTSVLSLTGWYRSVRDLIAYVQNSQYTLRAENFEQVLVGGLEAEGGLGLGLGRLGTLDAGLAYGWSLSRSYTDNSATWGASLPGFPEHELYMDVEAGGPRLAPAFSLEVQGVGFRDSANLQEIPARAFLHLRVSSQPWRRGPSLCVELRNALDHRIERTDIVDLSTGERAPQAVSDFLGYPLPGRALYLSVDWSLAPGDLAPSATGRGPGEDGSRSRGRGSAGQALRPLP